MAPTASSKSMMPSTDASASVLERVQSFVLAHKKALVIGAAVAVAAGGIALYASSSSRGGYDSQPGSEAGDLEAGEAAAGEAAAGRKKKKGKKKKTTGSTGTKSGDQTPIIEEIVPQTVDEIIAASSGAEKISDADRTALAAELKSKGNKAYGERKFIDAVKYYTRAIEITPEPDPVFYSNRAACYMYYSTPEYEKAVEDCTQALHINPKHERSIGRRGAALEKLGRYEEALRDFTAATLLTKFSDSKVAESVERVLKKLTEPLSREMFEKREPRLPPYTFVDAYFSAFRPRPIPDFPEEPTTGDDTLKLSLEALAARNYVHALSLVNEALDQSISFSLGKAYALNLRGSFKFLCGDSQGAKDDLQAAIEAQPSYTQSWVKIASVYMEQGQATQAFEAFDEAVKHDPKDPDIYYHRGQVHFIMQYFSEAAENYSKSTELDPNFVFSHIQLAVAQYKSGQIAGSMVTFRKALKTFPERSEPFNYYGELLLDQKRFEDAIEKFDRAIELEKNKKPPINVLSMVNKGLTLFQWKGDLSSAETIITEALESDPDCEAAVATLAQISLQKGDVEKAMKLFERQVELARTEADILNALQYMHATNAQIKFSKDYPDIAEAYKYQDAEMRAQAAAVGATASASMLM